jgi:hypothetical protein
MNWYKIIKSQALDEDGVELIEPQRGQMDYLDIGHGDFSNGKRTKHYPIVLWIWDKNGLHTRKTKSYKTHDDYGFTNDTIIYSGRYVPHNGELSIFRFERQKFRSIPSFVIQELKYQFHPIKIYVF